MEETKLKNYKLIVLSKSDWGVTSFDVKATSAWNACEQYESTLFDNLLASFGDVIDPVDFNCETIEQAIDQMINDDNFHLIGAVNGDAELHLYI